MIPTPDGSTRVEDGVGVVTVIAVYATSPDDLWAAITLPERLARWFGQVRPSSDDASSYDASLTTGWSGIVRVEECEPPRTLRLTLVDETEPATTVTASLADVDGGTRLTIEEWGLPADDLATYVAGWHAQVDQLLADLTGAAPVEWRSRWEQLHASYSNNPSTQV